MPPEKIHTQARRFLVRGRVQGVGFRWFVEREAHILQITGWVRNNPDGSVELSALDEPTIEALSAAEDWLLYQNLKHTAEFKTGSISVHWRGLGECPRPSA